jgi:putative ABC transport system substrate-binding protein
MKRIFVKFSVIVLFFCTAGWSSPTNAEDILAAIVTADLPRYQQSHEAMVKVLRTAGFGEGKLKVFKQTPNADKMSLVNSLRRAEAAGAKLIVTFGSQSTSIARGELKKTPLLFTDVYDPVALGAVKTLAAPGTNASGATSKTSIASLVENLMAIKQLKAVGVLYTKGEKGSEQQLSELKEQGKVFGFKVKAENARNPGEAKKLGKSLASESDAIFLTESVAVALQASEILAEAQASKCIVFSQIPGLVTAGALIGLEADPDEQGKLAAVHALQVLQGKNIFILPVREAKKISLKVSKKTATLLGLTVPPTVAGKAQLM